MNKKQMKLLIIAVIAFVICIHYCPDMERSEREDVKCLWAFGAGAGV